MNNFHFTSKDSFDEDNMYKIKDEYKSIVNDMKTLVKNNNLLNVIEKLKTAPNKQMGFFKEGWDKIKIFRDTKNNSHLYSRRGAYKNVPWPDVATMEYIKNSPDYYFIFSFVPRSNDIGLYNELGCIQLYTEKGSHGFCTIKYLTSDDFETSNSLYQTCDNIHTFNTIF